jgi:serine/threonine protein kinase
VISANKLRGLPPERALPIIRGMAAALAYAHQKGIVHSDFKPGNVFLTRSGEVKVIDFGIARAVPTELNPRADETVFDAAELGALTPPYASPEMLKGQTPSPSDDVVALGVVAHELLTGAHPFDRVPADQARMRGVVPKAIPGATRRQRRTVTRALSFDRASRPVDARVFLRQFEGPPRIQKVLSAAVALVLVAAVAWVLYEREQLRPDVPFNTLTAERQQDFFDAMADGNTALAIGDVTLDDALTHFSTAFDIHRNNPEAVDGLRKVADRTLEAMQVNDRSVQQRSVRRLFCQEYLSTYRPVVRACDDVRGAAQCTRAALGCGSSDGN